MAKRFVPIAFGLIEEGRFAASVEEALAELAKKHLSHVRQYGPDASLKAKSELTVKIALQFDGAQIDDDNPKDWTADFSVKGAISTKQPGRPSYVTRAGGLEGQIPGELELQVRVGGSSSTNPGQGKMFTDDGRATGEVTPNDDPPPPDRRSASSGK